MRIQWQQKPYWVMGVVNITPDSFSDAGQFYNTNAAIEHGLSLVEQGADILDLGAESTRSGAEQISVEVELARLLPVLQGIRQYSQIPISIDTSRPQVMQACLAAGADMVNDVRALAVEGACALLQSYPDVPVCLMHMQGEPKTMQQKPHYDDVIAEVNTFLQQRAALTGIAKERILLDPGFGFGKNLQHNISLFKALPQLVALGYPILVGVSRKRMVGDITGRENPQERIVGSAVAAAEAVRLGATVVRVHDVAATVDALRVSAALRSDWPNYASHHHKEGDAGVI